MVITAKGKLHTKWGIPKRKQIKRMQLSFLHKYYFELYTEVHIVICASKPESPIFYATNNLNSIFKLSEQQTPKGKLPCST